MGFAIPLPSFIAVENFGYCLDNVLFCAHSAPGIVAFCGQLVPGIVGFCRCLGFIVFIRNAAGAVPLWPQETSTHGVCIFSSFLNVTENLNNL